MGKDSGKISVSVMIEGDQIFTNEYNPNQPLQVIVQQTIAHFSLQPVEERLLRREDGTELNDLHVKLGESGIRDGETLRLFVKSKQHKRREGFA